MFEQFRGFWLQMAVSAAAVCSAAVWRLRRACRSEPLPCRPLVVVALCLAGGCAAARLMPAFGLGGALLWWGAAAVALLGWGVSSPRAGTSVAWLCAAVACAGGAWGAAQHDLFRADDLAWGLTDEPQPVAIRCTLLESPRLLPPPAGMAGQAAARGPSSECVVAVHAVRNQAEWKPASGRAAVVVDGPPPDLRVGSGLTVLGRGLRPGPALNPGEFDFRARARTKRCLSIVRVGEPTAVKVAWEPPPWWPAAVVDDLRRRGAEALHAHLTPSRAPLAAALLLGSRESLPREEADDFLVTGTVHILSISGLHVGLLAVALAACLRAAFVPRKLALVCVAACIGLYMLVVRAETPVVRATLLVWLTCLGGLWERRSAAVNALAAAAITILIFRPGDVLSAGAQLSFLSTAVLVGTVAVVVRSRPEPDPIERLIERSRSPAERQLRHFGRQAWELFVVGAAVWAVTAPMVAARFHVVSPVGILLNVVVAPLVPLAMAMGFACVLMAGISTTLAAVCGAGCDAALGLVAQAVEFGALVPGGHAWVPGPPLWWVVGWYGCLAAAMWLIPAARLRSGATWAAVAGCWCAIGIVGCTAASAWWPGSTGLRVVMAAMGHGCGIVVRSPGGQCLVYDAGRLGAPGAARRGMESVLWSEGISRIDTLVISHADADHFNAVPDLLARFRVGRIVVSERFLASAAGGVAEVRGRAAAWGVPFCTVTAGESFAVDPLCRVRVLHAGPNGTAIDPRTDDNESSLVLAVEAAGRRLLLTGDVEGESLARFVRSGPGACDVLVAPHHGSRTTLPADVAVVTSPDWVFVSGLGGRSWPEVQAAYRDASGRDAAVLKTGGAGAIAVDLDASAVRVAQFVAGAWRAVRPAAGARRLPPAERLAQGVEQRGRERGARGGANRRGEVEHHEPGGEHQQRAADQGQHLPDAERGLGDVFEWNAYGHAGHAVGHAALFERDGCRVFEGRAEEARVARLFGRDHDRGAFLVSDITEIELLTRQRAAGDGARSQRSSSQRSSGQGTAGADRRADAGGGRQVDSRNLDVAIFER
jgi:competence protein ComEC